MKCAIYKFTSKTSGKSYIGFSTNPIKRWYTHKHLALKGKRTIPFYNAIVKYGWDDFNKEIIYESFDFNHTLSFMENYFIKYFKSHISENGYNLDYGGGKFPRLRGKKNPSYKIRKGKLMSDYFTSQQIKNNKQSLKKRHSGKNNHHAKQWKLISPKGEIFFINGELVNFCKKHKLRFGKIYEWRNKGIIPPLSSKANRILNKKYLLNCIGWTVQQI